MTVPPTSPPSQPVPPAEQTTAAVAQPSGPVVDAKRPELVEEITEPQPDPRPRSLATQEIRLALAFTGGVSLAVWMGGVARELNLLVQASECRRPVKPEDPAKPVQNEQKDPNTPDANQVRRLYRRLLDLVDAEVAIDVLAGTSAGGINSALLGVVNARCLDLAPLRNIWLEAGDFGRLMRNPAEQSPPSLLQGDGQMLAALNDGVGRLLGQVELSEHKPETDVFITTTLLSPETSRFTDDYGTEIADTDHHGMFHFTMSDLTSSGIVAPLALAARSSASFPGAFEPSFLPFGRSSGADAQHPDLSPFSNATRAHWAADGGILVNRPIAPLLQRIFDRSADREVRRALLYVVPTSGSSKPPDEDQWAKPLGLAEALKKDLGAVLNQSIAADLAAIKEHNDRVRAAADTGRRMAALGRRLKEDEWLSDESAWRDYRMRQGDWLVTPIVAELSRQISTSAGTEGIPPDWQVVPGRDRDLALRAKAREVITKNWPEKSPGADDVMTCAVALGRPAFDHARATLLRILRLARVVATTIEQRNFLAKQYRYPSRPLRDARPGSIRDLVRRELERAEEAHKASAKWQSLEDVVTSVATEYWKGVGQGPPPKELKESWEALRSTYLSTRDCLRELMKNVPDPEPPDDLSAERVSLSQRRALAAAALRDYMGFFDRNDDVVASLLDLHVATRSVLPVLTEVAQPVELIQVSADTRTLLAPSHNTAASKLTGMQVHHFGAFYKPSWRANDWMWGRLDGCGWLVHVLLDPRRILAVLENDNPARNGRVNEFLARLNTALGEEIPRDQIEDLAFLDDESKPLPPSLPRLALQVAAVLQKHIAAEELPQVAAQVGAPSSKSSTTGAGWLEEVRKADLSSTDQVRMLLDGCPVSRETIAREANDRTSLFTRTATQAAAVATAAGTGVGKTPTSLKPTFATARTVTRTAYSVANQTRGGHRAMTIVGLAMLVAGTLALLTNITVLGLTGLVIFAAGAVVLGFGVGPTAIDALRILLALALLLLLAAPWLPWLWQHVYPWLSGPAVKGIDKHHWIWPVLLLLVLLPPASALGDLLRRRRSRPATRR